MAAFGDREGHADRRAGCSGGRRTSWHDPDGVLDLGWLGGDDRPIARHRERGKLPVRERIDRLIDPGSAFLELSPLAAAGVYDDEAPSAGLVTGLGRIEGTLCVVVANDATVKGGTYFPIT